MLIACFPPPKDLENVTRISLRRGVSASGPFSDDVYVDQDAKDGYDNWITYYEDEDPSLISGQTYFYQVQYQAPDDISNTSFTTVQTIVVKSELSYQLRVSTVYEQLQGLDAALFQGKTVYRMIGAILDMTEEKIRTRLQPTKVVEEIYNQEIFRKILGKQIGYQIQLRHFPVRSIEKIQYRVRGDIKGEAREFEDLDVLITNNDASAKGYNRGTITVWPRQASIAALFAGLVLGTGIHSPPVDVLIDYTHGYPAWPPGLTMHIANAVAGYAMEIMGEAITAGLSMRSVDGYAETYTASATTTIFSARRGLYITEYEKAMKLYRKPIWSF